MVTTSKPQNKRRGTLTLGNIALNLDNYHVQVGARAVKLSMLEFEALVLMILEQNRVLPYDAFARALSQASTRRLPRNLAVVMSRLRRKLGATSPFAITNVRRRGYGLLDGGLGFDGPSAVIRAPYLRVVGGLI